LEIEAKYSLKRLLNISLLAIGSNPELENAVCQIELT